MWKKIFMVIISFVGTFSVVYAMNHSLNATTSKTTLEVGDVFQLGSAKMDKANVEPLSWIIVDVNGSTAIALEKTGDLKFIAWSTACYSSMDCPTNGYPQGKGELYDWMHSNDGSGTGFITEFDNSVKGVNQIVANGTTIANDGTVVPTTTMFNISSGFLKSSPYIMTGAEHTAIAGTDASNGAILNSPNNKWWWLADSATYVAQNFYARIHFSPGSKQDWDYANATTTSAVRPSLKLDLSKAAGALRISYNATPQNISNYEYNINVSQGMKIGEVAYLGGVGTPTLSIVSNPNAPSAHSNDFKNFELGSSNPTTSPVDINIKASGAPDVVNGSLKAGDFYFRIEGVDSNGEPNPACYQDVHMVVDKTTPTLSFSNTTQKNIKVGDVTFSDTITTSNTELTSSDISYTLSGGTNGILGVNVNSTDPLKYDISIVPAYTGAGLPSTSTLSATLQPTANFNGITTTVNRDIYAYSGISSLVWATTKPSYDPSEVSMIGIKVGTLMANNGVGPFIYELVKTTDSSYDSTTGADNGSFTIANTSTASGTTIDVTTSTALAAKTYNIQFKVTDTTTREEMYSTGTVVVSKKNQPVLNFKDSPGGTNIAQKTVKLDNKMTQLLAEGGASDNANAIEYDYAPASMQGGINPRDIVTINKTTGLLTPIKIGKVKVQAKRPGNSTYDDVLVYMDLTIDYIDQTLSWSGTDIAKIGNDVKLKSGSTDTYEISMRYSGTGIDTYIIEELLNTASVTSGNFGIKSNITSGSLSLTYKPNYTNVSDNTKIYLSGGTGAKVLNVAGNSTGKMTIEVDSSALGDYTKSGSVYLEVSVNPSLSLKYTPLYTGNISASSSYATANEVLGDVKVQPTTETGYTYSITSITSGGVNLNGIFSIDANTGKLKVGASNLAVGSYDVNVQASKGGESTSATYTINVVNAAFPIASWKWQEDSSGSYKDVGGNFDSAFINTTTLSDTYEASKSIQVRLNGVDPTANVVYSLDGTTTGVINVTDKGSYAIVDILGASPVSSDVKVKATVSDPNGVYTTQDVWIPVDIKKYPQKIKFQDTTNLYLPNTAPCTQVPVVKNSTYWNQSTANPVILSTTSSAFTISGDKICPVSGQSVTGATLTANLNGDGNFDAASAITKTIHIYDPGTITVTQSIDSISGVASNVVYTPGTILEAMNNSSTNPLGSAKKNAISANVKLSGIASSSSNAYVLSTNTGNANIDAPLFTVAPNGNIALNQAISASDLMAHGSNIYKIQVDVKDVHNYVQTVDVHIKINDAQPDFYFTDAMANALPLNDVYVDGTTSISSYDETYVKNGTFDVYTNNSGAITYKVDTSNSLQASDVISQTSAQLNGSQFTFEHATELDGSGLPTKKAYIEACVGAQNGYQAKCIYSMVNVEKADQKFKFAANPIVMGINTANFTPVYTGHLDSEPVLITNSTDPTIVEGESFASGQLTDQNLKTFGKAGRATITAMAQGDRDYNSTTTTTVVDVTSRPPTTLTLTATPGATMIYGDTTGKVSIRTGYVNSKPAYFWSDDPSIIDVSDSNTQDDDSGILQIHKAGTTIINVCQTNDSRYVVGNACPSGDDYGYIQVSIQKADITLKYSNKNIKTGEALPSITLEATPTSGSFKGNDSIVDFPIPASATYRQNNTPLLDSTAVGTYNITGTYNSTEAAQSVIENYNVTFDNGTLNIAQDTSQANWFHLENAIDNILVDGTTWYNHDLNVVVDKTQSTSYDEISLDKTSWHTTPILYDNEGSHTEDVYFRSSTTKAFSTSQPTTMKIDKTKPEVTSITGIAANRNALQELLNALTFGQYFKPELEVSIKADDILPKGVNENSKLKSIHYEAYQLKDDGTLSDIIASGEMKTTDSLKLVDEGMYMVCATAEDNAENVSDEKCSGIRIHEIGEDSDDDGIPDLNIDTDGDGDPDINITKNPGDKKPWINIDTDGDGEPEMNIDRDGDRIPYLNTGIISEWTCDLLGDFDKDGKPDFKTSSTLKGLNNIDSDDDKHPDINIDLKLTGLPTLNINTDGTLENAYTNIDGDGDGIADINIDTTGDGIPEDKIMKIPSWVPNHDVKENGKVRYDTMELIYEEKDELEDNGIIIKPGKDNPSFLPNYALKVDDITSALDDETKNTIITITGEKSEVKQVFDVSLTDGEKVIQPNGSILVKIPVDPSIKNPRVLLRNEAGEFKEVEVVIENGYFVFETEHLGMVSIIGDKEEVVLPDPVPEKPEETPKDPIVPQQPSDNTDSSVKGTYTGGGVGGVSTGDQTTSFLWVITSLSSLIVVIVAIGNRKKRRN